MSSESKDAKRLRKMEKRKAKSPEFASDMSYEIAKVEATELPLASREDQPPLVVDLPEGQKLVVGRLEEGTVIEVASWRGTGRPDSRTSRLMLGITKDESESEFEEARGKLGRPKEDGQGTESSLMAAASHVSSTKKNEVNFEILRTATTPEPTSRSKPKAGKMNRLRDFVIRHKAGESVIAGVILLVVLITTVGGVSIVHPRSGAAISLGTVKNSLIAISRGSNVAVGDKIVVSVGGKDSPELVVVQSVAPQSVLTTANGRIQVVTRAQIRGRVLALFPFLGWPFSF